MIWWRDNENYRVERFRYTEDLEKFLNNLDKEDEIITVLNDGAYKLVIVKRGDHVE